jgi:hypothetical protein
MIAEEPTLKIMKIFKKWIGYFARKELRLARNSTKMDNS